MHGSSRFDARFQLRRVTLLLVIVQLTATACRSPQPDVRGTGFVVSKQGVTAEYDKTTGRLKRVDLDRDKNGRIETWSYWAGTRVERIEVDQDEDGRVDRWEHYGPNNELTRVGTSSRDDAVEDTWAYPDKRGFLFKVESDTDRDGIVDKRETFTSLPGAPDRRVLSMVELGLDKGDQASRRIYYKPDGGFDRSEVGPPR